MRNFYTCSIISLKYQYFSSTQTYQKICPLQQAPPILLLQGWMVIAGFVAQLSFRLSFRYYSGTFLCLLPVLDPFLPVVPEVCCHECSLNCWSIFSSSFLQSYVFEFSYFCKCLYLPTYLTINSSRWKSLSHKCFKNGFIVLQGVKFLLTSLMSHGSYSLACELILKTLSRFFHPWCSDHFMTICLGMDRFFIYSAAAQWGLFNLKTDGLSSRKFCCSFFFWNSSFFRCSPRLILRIYYNFCANVFFFVLLSYFSDRFS